MVLKSITHQVNGLNSQATPGVTPWAGIRQDRRQRVPPSLPAPAKNSSPLPDTSKPHYLDVGDNVHANVQSWLDSNCGTVEGQWFIPGICENGHRIAKVIVCGKEWCPRCSQKGSIAHNRRYVRWLSKIRQFQKMRYMVFTIPEDIRNRYRTRPRDKYGHVLTKSNGNPVDHPLTVLGRQVQELLKHQGFKRGLRRWHWFGDRSTKWHPHLNVLVEGGYLKAEKLEAIKRGWADILKVNTISINISYKPRPADMVGSLFYITRSTFLDYNWDMEMAMELRNFRNMVVWGKELWNDEPVWSLNQIKERMDQETGEPINIEAIEKIIDHKCHVCGGHLSWDSALPGELLQIVDKQNLGAGYYQIIDRPPPSFENTVSTRLTFEERKHPGDQVDKTYENFHARHKAHAEQFYNETVARELAADMWKEIR